MKINTFWLKTITIIADLFVSLFSLMLLLEILSSLQNKSSFNLVTMTSIPVFIATIIILIISFYLFQLYKLLSTNNFFTEKALSYVRKIRYSLISCTILFLAIIPLAYSAAKIDNTPGIIILALILIFIPLAIAAFVSVMEKILLNAINLLTK